MDPAKFPMLEALRRREACHSHIVTDARGIIVPNDLPWLHPKQPENLSVSKATDQNTAPEPPGANGEKAIDEDESHTAPEPESLSGLSDSDAADATKNQVEAMKAMGMDEISSPITDKQGLEDSEDSGSPTHPSADPSPGYEDIEEATKLKAEADPYDTSIIQEMEVENVPSGAHTAKGGIWC